PGASDAALIDALDWIDATARELAYAARIAPPGDRAPAIAVLRSLRARRGELRAEVRDRIARAADNATRLAGDGVIPIDLPADERRAAAIVEAQDLDRWLEVAGRRPALLGLPVQLHWLRHYRLRGQRPPAQRVAQGLLASKIVRLRTVFRLTYDETNGGPSTVFRGSRFQ